MKNIYLEHTKNTQVIQDLLDERFYLRHLARYWKRGIIPPANTINHANQSVEWPYAKEDKNKINPEYIGRTVMHTMDENGYRIYPNYYPTSDKKIFCFGCSETYGFSAMDEETWPYLMAKKLGNWQVKNYGMPGGSVESSVRLCYQVISSLKKEEYPDAIYFLLPDPFRTEYIGNATNKKDREQINHKHIVLATYLNMEEVLKNEEIDNEHVLVAGKAYSYYKYTSQVHSFFEVVKHFKFLQEILEPTGIQWYWYSWVLAYCKFDRQNIIDFFGENTLLEEDGLKMIPIKSGAKNLKARDNLHAAIGYTDPLTDELVKLYKK